MDTPQRIAKILSRAGIASRREVERLVVNGSITVNGKLVNDPATKVKISDKVKVNGELVIAPDVTRLWRYHKPTGFVTSTHDEKGRKTIFELIQKSPTLNHVGRLDKDTTGAIILTNDGNLSQFLMHPKNSIEKEYIATTDQFINEKNTKYLYS
mgnify:CR=1 FL=1